MKKNKVMEVMEYAHTSPNRTVYAAPLCGLASENTQSGFRPLCVFSPAHFAVAGLATQALIRNRKTSYTAGTLYDIGARMVGK
jgi:hypothetical protein